MEILDILTNCCLFLGKTRDDISTFLGITGYKVTHFRKNQFVFRMDQPTTYIGIILKGSVEVQKNFSSGKLLNLIFKETGATIGEGAIFSDTGTYPCNVMCMEKSTILLLPKHKLLELLAKDPILLANFLNLISNKLLMLNNKIELLSYSAIQCKIVYSLLHCLAPYTHNNIIHLPHSKKRWAEYLNVSRPSLCRELKYLVNAKIIAVDHKTIRILKRQQLEEIIT